MHKIILSVFILAIALSLKAQYAGYAPVADLAKFKVDFSFATQKTASIKSDFVQEKKPEYVG